MILSLCEKRYLAFGMRFETEEGKAVNIESEYPELLEDIKHILEVDSGMGSFVRFLIAGVLSVNVEEIFRTFPVRLTVDQGDFLIDLFKGDALAVAEIFKSMRTSGEIAKLIKISGKVPMDTDFSSLEPDEYQHLPKELLPSFVKWVCTGDHYDFDEETIETFLPFRSLFERYFSEGHNAKNSALYHILGFPPRKATGLFAPIRGYTCMQEVNISALPDYIDEICNLQNMFEPTWDMEKVSEDKIVFVCEAKDLKLSTIGRCLRKYALHEDDVLERFKPTIVFSGPIYSATDSVQWNILGDITKYFKVENNPYQPRDHWQGSWSTIPTNYEPDN